MALSIFMIWKLLRRKKRVRTKSKHYSAHKELARTLIMQKLSQWNAQYQFTYKRVAIRNTRRNWGSCTSLKNLNFNYRILFLPEHLQDYIIVHELCHLQELHHRQPFWDLVALQIPEYEKCKLELRAVEKQLHFNSIF